MSLTYTDAVSSRTSTGLPEVIGGLVDHISTSMEIQAFSVVDINELPAPQPSLTFVTVSAGEISTVDEFEDIIQPTDGNQVIVDFTVQVSLWVRRDEDQNGRSEELLSLESDSAARLLEALVRCLNNQELKINGEYPLMRAIRYQGTTQRQTPARQAFLQYVSTIQLQFDWGL